MKKSRSYVFLVTGADRFGCGQRFRPGSQALEIKNFDHLAVVRKPAGNMGRMLASSWKHLGSDQLAFARNGQRGPLGPGVVVPPRNQVIPPRGKPVLQQDLREIAYRHDVAAADQNAFDARRRMRKGINASQWHEFCHDIRRKSKTPLAHVQQDKRLRVEFEHAGHAGMLPSTGVICSAAIAAYSSSRCTSSSERNPDGLTTGTTRSSIKARPRYHCRSSPENARGSA